MTSVLSEPLLVDPEISSSAPARSNAANYNKRIHILDYFYLILKRSHRTIFLRIACPAAVKPNRRPAVINTSCRNKLYTRKRTRDKAIFSGTLIFGS